MVLLKVLAIIKPAVMEYNYRSNGSKEQISDHMECES